MRNYISKRTSVSSAATLEAPVRFFGACRVREKCTIGQFTFLNDRTTLFPKTHVGRYCSIGKSCEIGAPKHPVDRLTSSPVGFGIERHFPQEADLFRQSEFEQYSPTYIGADVWIGSLSVVVCGLTIGHGAVIGANSVVTSDIPPYAIAAGSPARVLRYRFDEDTIGRLLATQWWNRKPEEIGQLDFEDISACLDTLEQL